VELTQFLSEALTPQEVREAICYGFYNWLESGKNTPGISMLPHRKVMQIYYNQSNIGWQHFVRGRMIIDWGRLVNQHWATQKQYKFNAEHWGAKIMSINWKYILLLWELRNREFNGETPAKAESIRQQTMINEILHIQANHLHLPLSARQLISRDVVSLRAMNTTSISTYLYGAKLLAEAARQYGHTIGQQTIM
jgi:hypothetical protein